MRKGRITWAIRRNRHPVFRARCGLCGAEELLSYWYGSLGIAYHGFQGKGWRNLGTHGWTCPACSKFLEPIR